MAPCTFPPLVKGGQGGDDACLGHRSLLERAGARGITFPPLAKGGPGGVVTRASATVSPGVYVAKARGDRHNLPPASAVHPALWDQHFKVLNTEIYKNLDGVLEMIGSEVLARRGETGKS